MMKKRWKYVYIGHMGFPGGVPVRTLKRARRTRALAISRGGSERRRGTIRAPPGPCQGAPEARGTLTKSVLEPANLKKYGFPKEIHRFLKNAKALPGTLPGRFARVFGTPGGPWDPPGGSCRFPGGSRGAFRGAVGVPGGALGGPEAPAMTSAGYSWVYPSPKGLQETC